MAPDDASTTSPLRYDALLLVTAAIWGFAFVAQRVSTDFIGPLAFNGIRFALGALALVPLLLWKPKGGRPSVPNAAAGKPSLLLWGGMLAGAFLFLGASCQQAGLVHTTAGNAGFITGLYVVIVPIMGLAFRQRTGAGTWVGAALAAVGLYLLSVTGDFTIGLGDLLVLAGAFFWAAHVLIIGWLSPKLDTIKLAMTQFLICAALSLAASAFAETTTFKSIQDAGIPILYGGLASVGVAYTLQVFAQKKAHPAHASVILSMEAVFAAIGGWWLLGEGFAPRAMLGCALMLAGILVSQLWALRKAGNGRRGMAGLSPSP